MESMPWMASCVLGEAGGWLWDTGRDARALSDCRNTKPWQAACSCHDTCARRDPLIPLSSFTYHQGQWGILSDRSTTKSTSGVGVMIQEPGRWGCQCSGQSSMNFPQPTAEFLTEQCLYTNYHHHPPPHQSLSISIYLSVFNNVIFLYSRIILLITTF